jgi:hypothetical protein
LVSTVVEAEILTTAPVTSSARSAKDSGAERAWTGIGSVVATSARTAKQDAASRRKGRWGSAVYEDAGAFMAWVIEKPLMENMNIDCQSVPSFKR